MPGVDKFIVSLSVQFVLLLNSFHIIKSMDEGATKKRLLSILIGLRFVHSNEKSPIARTFFYLYAMQWSICIGKYLFNVRCTKLALAVSVN